MATNRGGVLTFSGHQSIVVIISSAKPCQRFPKSLAIYPQWSSTKFWRHEWNVSAIRLHDQAEEVHATQERDSKMHCCCHLSSFSRLSIHLRPCSYFVCVTSFNAILILILASNIISVLKLTRILWSDSPQLTIALLIELMHVTPMAIYM